MADQDLTDIFENIKRYTKSERSAQNVVRDIITTVKEIKYINQYQVDEFLGEPYRRIIVRDYKVVYKKSLNNGIQILSIIPTRKNPRSTL
ncbi:MAG: type II toxin-antitoxin system RelE/ParE family toxin [Flavobacteriales bacterium]|jgi:plasmid stabilization system protein ParE|nr:type II toxin-antitoxin system RelE/ParE family toxin [Flavobacteriales bacterium]